MATETPHASKRAEDEELVEGEFKGLTVKKGSSASSTCVVALDSRSCCDVDRWEVMPSVKDFPDLVRLDLHKSRYITVVHESVTELQQLQYLGLTRCTRLKEIPPTIDRLQNLQVVRNMKRVLSRGCLGPVHSSLG
jgi:protein gp37